MMFTVGASKVVGRMAKICNLKELKRVGPSFGRRFDYTYIIYYFEDDGLYLMEIDDVINVEGINSDTASGKSAKYINPDCWTKIVDVNSFGSHNKRIECCYCKKPLYVMNDSTKFHQRCQIHLTTSIISRV